MKKTVAILGAGPAGLYLAHKLTQRGNPDLDVVLLEKDDHVGGLSASFTHHGLIFDYGSHRMHPATAPEILGEMKALLGDDLLERPRNGRIFMLGRFVRFPLKPVDLLTKLPPRFGFGVFCNSLTKPFSGKLPPEPTFSDVLLKGLGKTICHDFYFPYARKLWGHAPEELSATQAYKRVAGSNVFKILKKMLGKKKKAIFYYPSHGFGQVCTAMADSIVKHNGQIRLNAAPISMQEVDGQWQITCADGTSLTADLVYSTIPTPTLATLLPDVPETIARKAASLEYRRMAFVYLVLQGQSLTPFDAHYFPGDDMRISRMSETKHYYNSDTPADRTGICLEVPFSPGDAVDNMDDAALANHCVDELERCGFSIRNRVSETFVKIQTHAYPVYTRGAEETFAEVDQWFVGRSNLILLGRQALYAHDNLHHAFDMAQAADDCLDQSLRFDENRWGVARERFTHHVVED